MNSLLLSACLKQLISFMGAKVYVLNRARPNTKDTLCMCDIIVCVIAKKNIKCSTLKTKWQQFKRQSTSHLYRSQQKDINYHLKKYKEVIKNS